MVLSSKAMACAYATAPINSQVFVRNIQAGTSLSKRKIDQT
jgi:hypothetical protein